MRRYIWFVRHNPRRTSIDAFHQAAELTPHITVAVGQRAGLVQPSSGDRTAGELLQKRTPIPDVVPAVAPGTGDDDDAAVFSRHDFEVVGNQAVLKSKGRGGPG